jgi:hypothetical protein
MARLDRVVSVELLSRCGVGVGIVGINILALLPSVIGWVSTTPTRSMGPICMLRRPLLDAIARVQTPGVACIVRAIDSTMAVM